MDNYKKNFPTNLSLIRAETAKEKFLEIHRRKTRIRSIKEMLSRIPKTEAERIECEMKREENREFAEMKKNIWKKWRGKNRIIENKTKLTDNEKVDTRMEDVTRKLEEYNKRKTRMRSIKEMLSRIPKTEAERIEGEVKSEERKELAEMKKNIWRK